MKKVQKVLAGKIATESAPAWFESAMAKVVAPLATKKEIAKLATKDDVQNVVPAWFESAMEKLATKEDLLCFYTKEEMSSSFRTIIDMLGECATKDDMKKMNARLDKPIMTLSNHETRIITLEGNLPVGAGRSSR